ncbi:hypothetical protein Murru_0124 [Allomuricauda ruestringensis DSM 13258]|uniref:2TM domain-containing protein n=1 Tax=Allomuricauda ruestringensis (strain DSM 13258 / CIP 107369 / LMG 19739 / B1) TaxID=886377 RepID=G2PR49_ALLRU|nr:2TM domain-containing protein [Allomuricauda ruestringensis]AEM69181.1 hypothetical protein Murru_0124 [Allomuricauda ruestringensis DSM 13258]
MTQNITFEQAKRKVSSIKGFYFHLALFIIISVVLITTKRNIVQWVIQKSENTDEGFLRWLDWNIIAIPIIWGVVLLVHGLYIFGTPLKKNGTND